MPNDRAETKPGAAPASVALDEEEFARRFEASGRLLWTLAAGILGDGSEADDVLQEAGMNALAKLDQFQPGTNFQAWMAQFVRNVALNHGRRRQRRRPMPLEQASLQLIQEERQAPQRQVSLVDASGELQADQGAFDDHVLAALRSLSTPQRSCLLLRSVLELSYGEIARNLGMPEGTAMSHVHRARALMRARLSGEVAQQTEDDLEGMG